MELNELKMLQALPLDVKIMKSKQRIEEWYRHFDGKVYVSFSGGKDSTVLLHLVRSIYPEVEAVFADTGLEYPEIREFVKTIDNVTWVKPDMSFKKVIETYGYPLISKKSARMIWDLRHPTEQNAATRELYLNGIKRDGTISKAFKLPKKWHPLLTAPFECSDKCCAIMKHGPIQKYEKIADKKPYIGVMAEESNQREILYMQTGCNSFDNKKPNSKPLGFWTEQDILQYIVQNNLPMSKAYGEIAEVNGKLEPTLCKRTGCMFCMFGIHLEKTPNRFQMMQKTHPKQYDYCINKLGIGEVLDYIGVPYGNQISMDDLLKEAE